MSTTLAIMLIAVSFLVGRLVQWIADARTAMGRGVRGGRGGRRSRF